MVSAALAALGRLGGEFLPEFREGHFVVHVWTAIPGSSLGETRRVGAAISESLLRIPRIATVEQQIGRAELGEDTWAPHYSEFHVELEPGSGADEIAVESAIREALSRFPAIHFDIQTFLGDRISETITGETSPVVVNVFGDDLDLLEARAARWRASSPASRGDRRAARGDLHIPTNDDPPEARSIVTVGLTAVSVLDTIETALQGAKVGESFEGNRSTDVVVILDPRERAQPELLRSLRLRNPEGPRSRSPRWPISTSSRRDRSSAAKGRRRAVVTCAVEGATSRLSSARPRPLCDPDPTQRAPTSSSPVPPRRRRGGAPSSRATPSSHGWESRSSSPSRSAR